MGVKTILLNFIIIRNNSGGNNYPNNQNTIEYFHHTLKTINRFYKYVATLQANPIHPGYNPPHISNSLIQFELAGVYFFENTQLNTSSSSTALMNYIKTHGPQNITDAINIFFTEGTMGSAEGYANRPDKYNWGYDQYVVTFRKWSRTVGSWVLGQHLAHELGHNLDLLHPYQGGHETCNTSDSEYMEDLLNDWVNDNCTPITGCQVCFHEAYWGCDPDLPSTRCTNNLMGGGNFSYYHITPLQMGKMHRALSIKSTQKYVKENAYSPIAWNISNNQTWDFKMRFYNDMIISNASQLTITCSLEVIPNATITIQSGSQITIDGTVYMKADNFIIIESGGEMIVTGTLDMGKLGRIIVKPGGKLTVIGGTITSSSEYPWKGIYVEGNRNLSQTFANQGALILQNGAVIENAHDAVVLRSQQSNWGQNGGIVQATNATFRNNWRDVEFNSYPLTSISFFQGCTFETTPQILHELTNSHVSMWDVQGVNFTNCTFTDTRPNIDYYSYRKSRNGIYGLHAAFVVDNCNFNAMKYGIYAISPDAVRTFKVYDSDFSGFLGVYFSGMDNAHVVNNTFFVKPGYMYSGPGQETYGLYVENSQNFEITGNILTSSGSQAPSFNSFGVIARNTGTIHQEIYRNDFTGFSNAIQAIGNNRSTGGEGLEIRCNRFYNNHSLDILIKTDPALNPLVPQGIREYQGIRGFPMNQYLAGNIFGSNTFFTNQGLPIYYYHHRPSSHPNLLPNYFSMNITFGEPFSYTYNYTTSCPVKQISRSSEQLLTQMEEGIQGQQETETRLAEMTDGGNTQLMLQQVQLTNSFNAYDTYKHLMNTSPWLSQEVLTAVASTTEGLNHAMIRDILVANPQAAKSGQVTEALENRKTPLPAYMMAQIEAGNEKWGEMELLQQQLAGYQSMYELALNEMVRNHMHEGDSKGLEAVDKLLAGIDDSRYQYWLAELAYSKGDRQKGDQLLQTIGKEIDHTDEYAMHNHQMYIDYYALLNQWNNEKKHPGFTGLPQEALEELKRFVNTGHRVSGKALAILLLNDAIQYREPIFYPEEEMVKKSAPATPPIPAVAAQEAAESLMFRLFPNPGRDYITLEWCMEQEHATGSRIEIFSAAGVPVQSIAIDEPCNQAVFSLENLQGGNYVARLVSGHKIKNISFVISR
jgi:hypothetical protein